MQHKNPIWLSFLAVLLLISLWFSGRTAYGLWEYYAYDKSDTVSSVLFSVKEKGPGEFAVWAAYDFHLLGHDYVIEEFVGEQVFSNSWVPKSIVKDLSKKGEWPVYYQAKDPSVATLHRTFPTKLAISTLVLFGLLAYFLWLGSHAVKMNQTMEGKHG